MNPETGEIKKGNFVPAGWEGLPVPDEEVEVIAPPNKRRGQMWKVVEIQEGTPGRMVLTPVKVKRNQPPGTVFRSRR